MPAPTFIGNAEDQSDVSIGAGADEVGVYLGDIDWTHENPEVLFLDRFGGEIGAAVNHNAALTMNVTGEVTEKGEGINVISWTGVASLVNKDFFASASATHNGLNYTDADNRLMAASGTQPRGGARTVSVTLRRAIGFAFI